MIAITRLLLYANCCHLCHGGRAQLVNDAGLWSICLYVETCIYVMFFSCHQVLCQKSKLLKIYGIQ